MRRVAVVLLIGACSWNVSAQTKGGLGALFGGLIGQAVGKSIGKAMADPNAVEDVLVKVADIVNKRMPMTVDQDTRMDNITPGPGKRLTYNYTITSAALREIDRPAFVQAMAPRIKTSACSSPDMRIFFEHGVTVGYLYRSSEGAHVAKLDVTPKDCGFGT